jgi:diaminopimelate decarboxylase
MAKTKQIPFSAAQLDKILAQYPTPFYLYDEAGIRESAGKLTAALSQVAPFRNFFAVKATPNPAIMKLLAEKSMGFDCSSLPELLLAERIGVTGEQLMFTSNDTAAAEFRKARELGAIINLDDLSHIEFLEQAAGLPELLSFRYNPGSIVEGNQIIGKPEEAKFGLPRDQMLEAYKIAKHKGVKRFGLHAMVVSNELDPEHFSLIVNDLVGLAHEITATLGIHLEFINLGGGIGIPYRPEEKAFDLAAFAQIVKKAYTTLPQPHPKLFMECGRYVTGPHGYLVATARHIKRTYKTFIGLDASMHNLMRPGMYGAYHHISILGKNGGGGDELYDVTGSLCENNDKFAINRKLPEVAIGDTVIIHDAGSHGHSMGFTYNGKLRSAELLVKPDGSAQMIRRPETVEDYFATLVS